MDGRSRKCSYRPANGEPLQAGAESRPEPSAASRFHSGVAFDFQRGHFGALVAEVLLGGGKLFLTGAAIFQTIEERFEILLRHGNDGWRLRCVGAGVTRRERDGERMRQRPKRRRQALGDICRVLCRSFGL